VVVVLDVASQALPKLVDALTFLQREELCLERPEEAFHGLVVEAVTFS
jgi:hypothetical protein